MLFASSKASFEAPSLLLGGGGGIPELVALALRALSAGFFDSAGVECLLLLLFEHLGLDLLREELLLEVRELALELFDSLIGEVEALLGDGETALKLVTLTLRAFSADLLDLARV